MKLPEKLKPDEYKDDAWLKINEIIDYLSELHEQQKPKHECKLNHCVPKCNKGNIVDEIVEKWKF